jgi:hypothetical protein
MTILEMVVIFCFLSLRTLHVQRELILIRARSR